MASAYTPKTTEDPAMRARDGAPNKKPTIDAKKSPLRAMSIHEPAPWRRWTNPYATQMAPRIMAQFR